jgi:hypothetical protein
LGGGGSRVSRRLYVLGEHHAIVRRHLVRFRGREIDTAGDGFFATFDGPAHAIRCACAIRKALADVGMTVRAGLHTGECELSEGKVGGIAVHIGARVAAHARPGAPFQRASPGRRYVRRQARARSKTKELPFPPSPKSQKLGHKDEKRSSDALNRRLPGSFETGKRR